MRCGGMGTLRDCIRIAEGDCGDDEVVAGRKRGRPSSSISMAEERSCCVCEGEDCGCGSVIMSRSSSFVLGGRGMSYGSDSASAIGARCSAVGAGIVSAICWIKLSLTGVPSIWGDFLRLRE